MNYRILIRNLIVLVFIISTSISNGQSIFKEINGNLPFKPDLLIDFGASRKAYDLGVKQLRTLSDDLNVMKIYYSFISGKPGTEVIKGSFLSTSGDFFAHIVSYEILRNIPYDNDMQWNVDFYTSSLDVFEEAKGKSHVFFVCDSMTNQIIDLLRKDNKVIYLKKQYNKTIGKHNTVNIAVITSLKNPDGRWVGEGFIVSATGPIGLWYEGHEVTKIRYLSTNKEIISILRSYFPKADTASYLNRNPEGDFVCNYYFDTDYCDNLPEIQNRTNVQYGILKDLRDKKSYKTVKIGNVQWMAENLAYKPVKGNFRAYADEEHNIPKYGYMYDWTTSNIICPVGWHLPKEADILSIIDMFTKDKERGYENLLPRGESGFNVLFGGQFIDKKFIEKGESACFWTSTVTKDKKDYAQYLLISRNTNLHVGNLSNSKTSFLSVRCIKNTK